MEYVKKTWESGDTITSEALNNMEEGIAKQNPMIVTMTPVEGGDDDYPTFTADRTIAEIAAAFNALTPVYFRGGLEGLDHMPLIYAMYDIDEESTFGVALAGFTAAQVEGGEEGLAAVSLIGQIGEDGEDVWMLVDWDSGKNAQPIELDVTLGAGDSITFKETARELSNLCEKGKMFRLTLKESGGNYLGSAIASITVINDAAGKYNFRMSAGVVYTSAELNENDSVVLTVAT